MQLKEDFPQRRQENQRNSGCSFFALRLCAFAGANTFKLHQYPRLQSLDHFELLEHLLVTVGFVKGQRSF